MKRYFRVVYKLNDGEEKECFLKLKDSEKALKKEIVSEDINGVNVESINNRMKEFIQKMTGDRIANIDKFLEVAEIDEDIYYQNSDEIKSVWEKEVVPEVKNSGDVCEVCCSEKAGLTHIMNKVFEFDRIICEGCLADFKRDVGKL